MRTGGELWKARAAVGTSSDFNNQYGRLLGLWLKSRGFSDPDLVQKFLSPKLADLPQPTVLKNLQASVEKLADVIGSGGRILVYGDYDVDGMSALTLLASFFDRIPYENYGLYQPHRFEEGYGVHVEALERLYLDRPFEVLLTVDTGIGAVAPAEWAKEKGVTFIITDHHLAPAKIPDTPYIVNPNQGDCTSELGYLCGTGVAFFIAAGLKKVLRERDILKNDFRLEEFLDLFALATVADQMELVGINRALVKEGLKRWPTQARPGLRALMQQAKCDARDIAFSVAPKLNAASRLGKVESALKLLLAKDDEEAWQSFKLLQDLNEVRGTLQAVVLDEARQQLCDDESCVLLACGESWTEGVLGIVAAKLVDDFALPALVLTRTAQGNYRGSMRCPSGFHAVAFLEGAKHLLSKYGGHELAAGLEVDAAKIDAFRAYCRSIVWHKPEAIVVDYDADLEFIPNVFEVEAMETAGPWGRGNPAPLFRLRDLDLSKRTTLKEKHVKWSTQGTSIIGFNFESFCQNLVAASVQKVDVLVVPEVQEFRNLRSVQLRIVKIKPAN